MNCGPESGIAHRLRRNAASTGARMRHEHARVAPDPLPFPGRGICPQKGLVAYRGDVHGGVHGRPIFSKGRHDDRLLIAKLVDHAALTSWAPWAKGERVTS